MLNLLKYICPLFFTICLYGQTVYIPDPGLRECIKQRNESLITFSGQLDINKAGRIRGNFYCKNKNIQTAEGIQYFTSLHLLDLDSNQISYFPDISNSSSLQHLSLKSNKLSDISNLSDLKRLKTLYISDNFLKSLPVGGNDSLEHLVANANLLDSLPDLSRFNRLKFFDIRDNNLIEIKGIENLISLEHFFGYNNRITHLPSLEALKEIKFFDVALNELSTGPYFGRNSRINFLHIHSNNLVSIPDYSVYRNLNSCHLKKNNLTFEDLVKLSENPNYKRIFNINFQKKLILGKAYEFREGEEMLLKTNTDTNVSGISYEWYHNGTRDTVLERDNFKKTVRTSDSGYYHCKIKHPSFPGFWLETDSFYLNIKPCLEIDDFILKVSDIDCFNTGSITVIGQSEGYTNYTLKSKSGKLIVSSTGNFNGLSEEEYQLIVEKKNCNFINPNKISLQSVPCKDFLITPDNDGNMDTYYFSEEGEVKIFDKRGIMIKEMKIPGEWDCTNQTGKVPAGYYIAYINNGQSQIGLSILY